jgi:hypothetical protein
MPSAEHLVHMHTMQDRNDRQHYWYLSQASPNFAYRDLISFFFQAILEIGAF